VCSSRKRAVRSSVPQKVDRGAVRCQHVQLPAVDASDVIAL
jgi:hypothetical protein